MTDKIITTFETILTWYDPQDKLPLHTQIVLIKPKELNFLLRIAYKIDVAEFDNMCKSFDTENFNYKVDEIQWWAYLPEFE